MVRKLKHHEQKLLKKVDFLAWKQDANIREIKVLRRYHIQNREDYHKYNKLCGALRSYAHRLSMLPAQDPFRAQMEGQLLSKLYDIGVLTSQTKLSDVENRLSVAAFCRRRLAVFMCMNKMAETVSAAAKFIEQGHVRVGPDTITDPAFLVTRHAYGGLCHLGRYLQTQADGHGIQRRGQSLSDLSHVLADRIQLDDFDLL
ncbi:alpha-L RNA-binding motif-containing protein [Lanmaoa asiatica]|nr:alpha-L RNA-binding motif-containing protein [Lanmaoa asiatica]